MAVELAFAIDNADLIGVDNELHRRSGAFNAVGWKLRGHIDAAEADLDVSSGPGRLHQLDPGRHSSFARAHFGAPRGAARQISGVDEARRTAGWTLFFLLTIALAAPAYVAFAQLTVVRDLAGTGLELLPGWVYAWALLVTIASVPRWRAAVATKPSPVGDTAHIGVAAGRRVASALR